MLPLRWTCMFVCFPWGNWGLSVHELSSVNTEVPSYNPNLASLSISSVSRLISDCQSLSCVETGSSSAQLRYLMNLYLLSIDWKIEETPPRPEKNKHNKCVWLRINQIDWICPKNTKEKLQSTYIQRTKCKLGTQFNLKSVIEIPELFFGAPAGQLSTAMKEV